MQIATFHRRAGTTHYLNYLLNVLDGTLCRPVFEEHLTASADGYGTRFPYNNFTTRVAMVVSWLKVKFKELVTILKSFLGLRFFNYSFHPLE